MQSVPPAVSKPKFARYGGGIVIRCRSDHMTLKEDWLSTCFVALSYALSAMMALLQKAGNLWRNQGMDSERRSDPGKGRPQQLLARLILDLSDLLPGGVE